MSVDIQYLVAHAKRLLASSDLGAMGHSEYDAGWVARVPVPGTQTPAFPEVLATVRETQREDGSWGPCVPYISARILSTLSSLLALVEFEPRPETNAQIQKAISYVLSAWPCLTDEPELTVGFELLSAALLEEACRRGLPFDPLLENAQKLRKSKLAKIPEEALYSPSLSIGHSLEFLGDQVDVEKTRKLQVVNGSIGATIATTAFFAIRTGDPAAMQYLRGCVDRFSPTCLPYGHPSHLWASIWVLYSLYIGEMLHLVEESARPHLELIRRSVGTWGLSWSTLVEYGDADDTSVGLTLLAKTGIEVDWRLLHSYEGAECYRTYFAETHPSVSVNAHVLFAMREFPAAFSKGSRERVLAYLCGSQADGGYWTDKWHASPFYATSRVIRAVARDVEGAARAGIEWILRERRADGGWGFFGESTAEETAFAIQALAHWRGCGNDVPEEIFLDALRILLDRLERGDYADNKLWIEKTLYCPLDVVESSLLAAASLCILKSR